ncbi:MULTISPECIES: MmcQ/YjbR family DNA-binding protein [unclassified Janthinobacterium]|uniref:MmcQ/YjbR family DNA-binding protein n=1 Tax=unclassified Janthinobacterium TaxID=2610881 RepID=UPI00034A3B38|nr:MULTISPECIES: MmcQ/YjbR family DNA-binding protein [unclassified Janthinobacterium]MEC5159941.1 putative DNA-binding protein (MmcQ/YjbR family) [Janthinobacterium sp. CG_S6]
MNLEQAKAVCRALPGAVEDVKWGGDIVFSVGLKMFAVASGAGDPPGISFKVEEQRFLELTDRPGIMPAPYLARAKWVRVSGADALDDAEAAALLLRSYQLVFAKLTKKLQHDIGGPQA